MFRLVTKMLLMIIDPSGQLTHLHGFGFSSSRKIKRSAIPFVVAIIVLSSVLLLCYQWYLERSDWSPAYGDGYNGSPYSNTGPESRPKVRKLPGAIIVGARKSGTRAVLKFLEINRHVRPAHSEVHFFDKPQNYKLGLQWYRNKMPLSYVDSLTIEKSPAYFVTKGVPEKIKQMNPAIKLILVVRDPVKRLISDFSQLIANRIENANEDPESYQYFSNEDYKLTNNTENELWDKAQQEFRTYVLRRDGGIDDRRSAIRTGMYSIHLERWLFHFNLSQIHVVDGETLILEPYKELKRLEQFLSLDSQIKPDHFVYNQQKGFFCISASAITRREPSSHPNSTSLCLSRSKGRRHVQVDKSLANKLSKFYEPYNDYLYSIIGRKFDWE